MNASVLLFGILPLLAFVIIDSFAGLKSGVIAAILFAIAEVVYTLVVYKTIDNITIGSAVLVLVFGLGSLKANNPLYLKLQPVVLGVALGAILVVMQFMGEPLLVTLAQKYQFMFPEEYRFMVVEPEFLAMLGRLSGVLGWGMLVHSALVAYSAFKMNKWWWIAIRGIGFYIMLFGCALWVRLTTT